MAKAPLILSLGFVPSRRTTILLSCTLASPFWAWMNSTKPRGIGEFVVVELDRRALRSAVQLGDPRAFAHRLDAHDQQQRVDLFRQLAEAVDQLGGKAFQFDLGVQSRQAPVEPKAHVKIGHVSLWDQDRHAEVDLRRPLIVGLAQPLQLARP